MIDCPVCDPSPKHRDPVDSHVSNMKAPGGRKAGQLLSGTQASGTQIRRGGIIRERK